MTDVNRCPDDEGVAKKTDRLLNIELIGSWTTKEIHQLLRNKTEKLQLPTDLLRDMLGNIQPKKTPGFKLTSALALRTAIAQNASIADLIIEDGCVRDFTLKQQGPEALVQAMAASYELQRAFQRLHPDQTVFHPTFR
jgi:hypothetical protein